MNFCKESDRYIALYVDDLLEPKEKAEFLNHVEHCSECKQKLDQMSLIADLCREDDGISLPDDFSLSLHNRLAELNVQEKNSKIRPFAYNKKWIAGLSTAAVLVISLFAYNMLPNMNPSKTASMSDNGVAMDAAAAGGSSAQNYGGSQEKASAAPEVQARTGVAPNSQRAGETTESAKVEITTKEQNSSQDAPSEDSTTSARKSAESKTLPKMAEESTFDTMFSIMAIATQYNESSVELRLDITTKQLEITALKQVMKEVGAEEVYVSLSDQGEIQYFDYRMPLNRYDELFPKATNVYHLKLTPVTEIVKNDITAVYDELNIQKNDVEQNIEANRQKGLDVTELETERNTLIQKINDILVKNDSISVKISIYR